jgi:hypothetical protein
MPKKKSNPYRIGSELIVVAKAEAALRARTPQAGGLTSAAGADTGALARILGSAVMTPLFGSSEERVIASVEAAAAPMGASLPDLSVFYSVACPPDQMEEMCHKLGAHSAIAGAYIKPPSEPAVVLNDMAASPADAPPATPNFEANQVYLGAAPAGIEALWANGRPGGRGNAVRIIDIEGAWRFSHEDLMANQGGVIGGVQFDSLLWRNHGTAVIGVFGGDQNAIGIRGIAPNANTRAISQFTNAAGNANSANAIRTAADALSPGDIILIELHRPGPGASGAGQDGFIAIEFWEDDFQAIRYATGRGVIVVEAAGNGARNLSDPLYNTPMPGFPVGWTNPFNRANRDSGAIIVGAGAPPPGTHGADWGPDRSRLDFSNYGANVDAQGWGREVTTTGYGDLQGGPNEDLWYTDRFSGTSSASPIVVGAVACLQGIRRAAGQVPYTPAQVRTRLRNTGSPQTDAPGRPATQRIGNRPNLRQLVGGVKSVLKDAKGEKVEVKEIKEVKSEKAEKEKVEKFEKPEIKEFKEFKEGKSELDKLGEIFPQAQQPAASLEQRVAAIESMLGMGAVVKGSEVAPPAFPPICTPFSSMPLGPKPNPLLGFGGASFSVRGPDGPEPTSTIQQWFPDPTVMNETFGPVTGLFCYVRTVATLLGGASQVQLRLAHFSPAGAGTIRAMNPAGVTIAMKPFLPALGRLDTYTLNAPAGQVIQRVVILSPNDRTLLGQFCLMLAGPPEAPGAHFIGESLRPDLSTGALTGEEDFTDFEDI